MKKLEIGPGKKKLGNDWTTVNVVRTAATDYVAEWGKDRLPFNDATFAEVYSAHTLEHVPWTHTHDALMEVNRVMRKGGLIEIHVPNLEVIFEGFAKKKPQDSWRRGNPDGDYMKWVNGRLFTYGPGLENFHRAAFTPDSLKGHLADAGFKTIAMVKKTRGSDHGPINLGIKGYKL